MLIWDTILRFSEPPEIVILILVNFYKSPKQAKLISPPFFFILTICKLNIRFVKDAMIWKDICALFTYINLLSFLFFPFFFLFWILLMILVLNFFSIWTHSFLCCFFFKLQLFFITFAFILVSFLHYYFDRMLKELNLKLLVKKSEFYF